MATIGAKESVRNLDDLALASLKLALADIRELAALAATSQREAFDIVQHASPPTSTKCSSCCASEPQPNRPRRPT